MKRIAMMALGALLLGGCAAGDPPDRISKSGCTVDLKKVCQHLVDQPGFSVDAPGTSDHHGWTLNNSPMQHVVFHVPFNGSGALLRCKVDTKKTHTPEVIEANLESGPEPDDTNFKHLREQGLCQ